MAEYTSRIHFRVTKEQKKIIEQRMQEFGTTNRSAYIRKAMLNGPIIHLDLSPLKGIIAKLKVLTNITNKCAKRANENGQIYEEDIKDIKNRQAEILEDMKKFNEYLEPLTGRYTSKLYPD